MNEKQEKFAQAYVLHRNATEAAKAAGYSERSSATIRDIDYFRFRKS